MAKASKTPYDPKNDPVLGEVGQVKLDEGLTFYAEIRQASVDGSIYEPRVYLGQLAGTRPGKLSIRRRQDIPITKQIKALNVLLDKALEVWDEALKSPAYREPKAKKPKVKIESGLNGPVLKI